jgi:hypothetical protein
MAQLRFIFLADTYVDAVHEARQAHQKKLAVTQIKRKRIQHPAAGDTKQSHEIDTSQSHNKHSPPKFQPTSVHVDRTSRTKSEPNTICSYPERNHSKPKTQNPKPHRIALSI